MTGLRKRVTMGFMGIVTLLFLSGMLSFFELNTLSNYMDDILKTNRRNMNLARELLDVAQLQNNAFVDIVAFGDRSRDTVCIRSYDTMDRALSVVRSESLDESVVDSMTVLANRLREISIAIIAAPIEVDSLDTLVVDRATLATVRYDEYQEIYTDFIASIYDYMTSAQRSIAPRADQLHRNAYRAVTPVFISLVVMIAIVLMLYYFMLISCVNPILHINRALKETMAYKVPFDTKHEYRDEVEELKDRIESLTAKSKQIPKI